LERYGARTRGTSMGQIGASRSERRQCAILSGPSATRRTAVPASAASSARVGSSGAAGRGSVATPAVATGGCSSVLLSLDEQPTATAATSAIAPLQLMRLTARSCRACNADAGPLLTSRRCAFHALAQPGVIVGRWPTRRWSCLVWDASDRGWCTRCCQQTSELGLHLLGRRLSEVMAFWETAEERNPSAAASDSELGPRRRARRDAHGTPAHRRVPRVRLPRRHPRRQAVLRRPRSCRPRRPRDADVRQPRRPPPLPPCVEAAAVL
jgi:hypothetical protein